jgi:hypothetical protein
VNILDQIDAANLPQPSLVTLHVHKAPAREVYESVFQQVQTKLKTMHGDHLWRRHGQNARHG